MGNARTSEWDRTKDAARRIVADHLGYDRAGAKARGRELAAERGDGMPAGRMTPAGFAAWCDAAGIDADRHVRDEFRQAVLLRRMCRA